MRFRPILLGAGLAGVLTATTASAAEGIATGNVNMRTCASTSCAKITTIPAGAPVEVYGCGGWCELDFAGRHGFASAKFIAIGRSYVPVPPPLVYEEPFYDEPYFFRFDYGHRRPIFRRRHDGRDHDGRDHGGRDHDGRDHDGHHDRDNQGQYHPPGNNQGQFHPPGNQGRPQDLPHRPPSAGSNGPRQLPFYGDAVQQRRQLDSQPQLNGWQRGLSGGSPCPPGMNGNCR